MPTIKKLYISSGVAVTAPTDLTSESSTVKIQPYADDAAFVTANGTAQEGDIYINTTIEGLRMYSAGAWRSVAMLSDPADATKVWAVDSTGATTGTSATFDFNQTASRVYTFPDYAGIAILNTNTETSPTLLAGASGTTTLGHASGTVVLLGNLQVDGTTTSVNSTNLEVVDKNILVNNGGNDASSEGAGLTVERTGTNGSIIYKDASATKFALGAAGSEADVADISTAQTLTNKTISGASNTITNVSLTTGVTGNLPLANGGLGASHANANAALNTLLPTQTGNNGKYLQTDGTNTTWAPASGGGSESVLVVTSANYTVLDGDGYTTILVTTGASNRTITLPALASNTSRVIRIKKIDTGAGTVIIDGDSAETIEAASTYTLYAVNQAVEIQADAEWKILNRLSPSYIDTTARAANSSGYGSFAAVRREIYEAYQTYTGQWRLKFSLTFAGGSATPGNSFEYTITGVTFKNVSDYDQPIPATAGVSGFNQSGAISAFAITNTNTVRAYTTNSPQPNLFFWSFNGDVELESQPAWV